MTLETDRVEIVEWLLLDGFWMTFLQATRSGRNAAQRTFVHFGSQKEVEAEAVTDSFTWLALRVS